VAVQLTCSKAAGKCGTCLTGTLPPPKWCVTVVNMYVNMDLLPSSPSTAQVPGALIEQLVVGGRLIVPVGPEGGSQVRATGGWLGQVRLAE
jgi:hypothetical protein